MWKPTNLQETEKRKTLFANWNTSKSGADPPMEAWRMAPTEAEESLSLQRPTETTRKKAWRRERGETVQLNLSLIALWTTEPGRGLRLRISIPMRQRQQVAVSGREAGMAQLCAAPGALAEPLLVTFIISVPWLLLLLLLLVLLRAKRAGGT